MINRATKNDSWVRNPDRTMGFTCNLITGCDLDHDYCFARELAEGRLREQYLANDNVPDGKEWEAAKDPFYPRFWPDRLQELDKFLTSRQEPSGVFLNIMGDWGCPSIPREWVEAQFDLIARHERHRFYILTHHYKALREWSPYPDHCYVGATANADGDMTLALSSMACIQARVRFISIEPYLGFISLAHNLLEGKVEWLIVGAMTCGGGKLAKLTANHMPLSPMPWGRRYTLQPNFEWVQHIGRFTQDRGRITTPVYFKDNLMPLVEHSLGRENYLSPVLTPDGNLRQEFPDDKEITD